MRKILPFLLFSGLPLLASAQPLPQNFQIAKEEEFKAELRKFAVPAGEWLAGLGKFDFLCLGESHYAAFREAYAGLVLKKLAPKRLAVEATPEEAKKLLADFRQTGGVSLLGADFTSVLQALDSVATLEGVEPSLEEDRLRSKDASGRLSRDGFIALHASALLEQGPLVALYGALHCSEWSSGMGFSVPFFRLLKNQFPEKKLISVLLLPEREVSNPVRVYADSFGLTEQDMVLVNARKLDPRFYNYRSDIEQVFRSYQVILLPRRTIPVDNSER